MMRISIRELKANPTHAVAMAQGDERVQITSRRKVVAKLVRPAPARATPAVMSDEEAMQRLVDAGIIAHRATKPFKLARAMVFPPGPDGQTMSDLVIELRGPR